VSALPTFNWQPVTGAVRYELWVNRIDVSLSKVIFDTNLTGTSFTSLSSLTAGGQYRAWVRAVSATGEFGAWSTGLNFTVASVVVPDSSKDGDSAAEEYLFASLLTDLLDEIESDRRNSDNVEVTSQ
ncbi:MAG: fibronectin type III domain-containing protein, partial [Planctomyces sp.]